MRYPALALLAAACFAQQPDLLELTRLKDYAAFRASSNNSDLASNDDSKRPIPGETVTLADLQGPGVVTHIWLTVAASEYGWPRLLRFRVYYDGSETPSVDVPLGDFFAVGHGQERAINSVVIRNSSSGRSRNSYWPMPFRRSCRITVTNEGRRRVSNLYYHVDWRKVPSLPKETGYLHALYRQDLPARKGEPYNVLTVEGRGHYVGTVLNVVQNEPGWFGEGDDSFYVDGAGKASIEGTGTEDYFNDAWSLRVAEGPYAGVSIAEGTGLGARLSAYRWHLADPIPFKRSLRFDFEHAGWTFNADGSVRSGFEERADLFSSVAYWYHDGVAAGLPEPPYGSARLPHGNARQIEVETLLAEVKTAKGKAEVQKEVFWSRDLLFLAAEGPGARVDIPFDIREDGNYELLAQIAHAENYGIYAPLVDGQPLTALSLEHEPGANLGLQGSIDAWYSETYVAEDHVLGRKQLAPGRHLLSFLCTGKNSQSAGYNLGIDTLVVARVASPVTDTGEGLRRAGASEAQVRAGLKEEDPARREAAAWAFTQRKEQAAASAGLLTEALDDADPVVRGLAAIALKNCAPCGAAARGRLAAHLSDADENVRLAVADALASLGPDALPALEDLIRAARRPGEHVHVQRSVASALGAIGPPAARGLPELEKLKAIPRVQWAAEAAVAKIKGPPK